MAMWLASQSDAVRFRPVIYTITKTKNLIEWVGDEYNRSVTKNQSRLKLMAITLRLTLGFLTLQACALAALAYFLL